VAKEMKENNESGEIMAKCESHIEASSAIIIVSKAWQRAKKNEIMKEIITISKAKIVMASAA
jgi:hypothetical protein